MCIRDSVYIGEDVDDFEKLLEAERVSVELFVRFRMNSKADAKIFSHNHIPVSYTHLDVYKRQSLL